MKLFKIELDNVVEWLQGPKRDTPKVIFPFDDSLINKDYEIETKILFINKRESTQIKNKDIDSLKGHIEAVLSDDDMLLIRDGNINDEYCAIIKKIATGHGIHRKGVETEFNLTSFASKYCGSHNQKAPFWDNLVYDLLKYFKYKHEYRNYQEYINVFNEIQNELSLNDFSLREIEAAMWHIAKEATSSEPV